MIRKYSENVRVQVKICRSGMEAYMDKGLAIEIGTKTDSCKSMCARCLRDPSTNRASISLYVTVVWILYYPSVFLYIRVPN